MMKTITINIYTFDELSDKAKEKARDWYRECCGQDSWWDSTYDDAERIGLKLAGFDLDRNRHAEGKFIAGAVECAHKIEKEHSEQCETHQTAQAFLKARDAIIESAERDEYGDFIHLNEVDSKLDDCEAEFLKSILEDYSIMLQKEYDWIYTAECVDEQILANEYTFTETGKRMG